MKTAETFAELSHARRLHVGAIVVKDDRIISIGYNGMPAGWDNNCEDTVWDPGHSDWMLPYEYETTYPFEAWHEEAGCNVRHGFKTKPEVLHAETNAIAKLAKSTESGDGAVLFVTHSPCLDCAKLIFQSGIRSVFYRDNYRSTDGVAFLEKSGIEVKQIGEIK